MNLAINQVDRFQLRYGETVSIRRERNSLGPMIKAIIVVGPYAAQMFSRLRIPYINSSAHAVQSSQTFCVRGERQRLRPRVMATSASDQPAEFRHGNVSQAHSARK